VYLPFFSALGDRPIFPSSPPWATGLSLPSSFACAQFIPGSQTKVARVLTTISVSPFLNPQSEQAKTNYRLRATMFLAGISQ
jgi:hypothetical protein